MNGDYPDTYFFFFFYPSSAERHIPLRLARLPLSLPSMVPTGSTVSTLVHPCLVVPCALCCCLCGCVCGKHRNTQNTLVKGRKKEKTMNGWSVSLSLSFSRPVLERVGSSSSLFLSFSILLSNGSGQMNVEVKTEKKMVHTHAHFFQYLFVLSSIV